MVVIDTCLSEAGGPELITTDSASPRLTAEHFALLRERYPKSLEKSMVLRVTAVGNAPILSSLKVAWVAVRHMIVCRGFLYCVLALHAKLKPGLYSQLIAQANAAASFC
jgi:hypothetical protein